MPSGEMNIQKVLELIQDKEKNDWYGRLEIHYKAGKIMFISEQSTIVAETIEKHLTKYRK